MRLLGLVFLCCIGVGCNAIEGMGVKSPTAVVHDMDVRDITAEGFTMDFDVEVANPNTFALPLTKTDYRVALSGVEAVSGNVSPDGSIPAGGSGRVVLPVSVTWEQLIEVGEALAGSGGSVPYRFDASLGTDSRAMGGLLESVKVPIEYEGTLDLASLLRDPDALTSPAARELARQVLGRVFGL